MAESTQCLNCKRYLGLCSCERHLIKIPEEYFTGLKVCPDKK